jgi:hypothetical protein
MHYTIAAGVFVKTSRRNILAFSVIAPLRVAIAQTNPPHYRASFAGPFASIRTGITGAPFAIEQVGDVMVRYPEGRRPLAGREWLYRDSQGRTRGERPMTNSGGDSGVRLVQIVDWIAGYQYVIDTVNKIAHRIKEVPSAFNNSAESSLRVPSVDEMSSRSFHSEVLASAGSLPGIKSQNIGNRVIEGIRTRGVRTIIEYPGQSPNDPTTVVSTDAWVSDERKVIVASTRYDPKWGVSMARLIKATFAEPDKSLFGPPTDYSVIDQPGPFSIDIALPG